MANLTRQVLRVASLLVLGAVVVCALNVTEGNTSATTGILNLLVALALPTCAFIGVKDRVRETIA